TRLLSGVIFPEAGLVSADDAVERRYRWVTRGAVACGVLTLGTAAGIWTNSYLGNVALISDAQEKVSEFQALAARIPTNPVADADLPAVVPALNILRDLPGNPAARDPEPPVELTFGLYQGDAVGTESGQSYRAALGALLLPRLLFRLEEQLQANLNNDDVLFEALKVYLMLGLQGPMDAAFVTQWMRIDWALSYPGQDDLQADLARHLEDMLNQPMREIALNGPLVEQIQALLAETPLAERIYQSLVTAPAARALPDFRLTEVGGPAVSRVLLRPSGEPLSAGIEGVYTYEAFHGYVLPQIAGVAERIQYESWVLGPRAEAEMTPQALQRLARDVLDLYSID
ncbi:MAG: ImcF-related family protein, partial [Pseudomonadota bacterium]